MNVRCLEFISELSSRTTFVTVLLLSASLHAGAEPAPLSGTAQAISGKFSGAVQVQNGKLTVGDRELKLEDTLYLAMQTPEAAEAPTNALRMVNGEYWRVNLLGLSDQAVTVINPAMNRERRVGLESIAALEFSPEDTRPDMDRPETMYRREGAALPGTLVWIKNSDVAVQSLCQADGTSQSQDRAEWRSTGTFAELGGRHWPTKPCTGQHRARTTPNAHMFEWV